MNDITIFGRTYGLPAIKDGRFDELQRAIQEGRERVAQSDQPRGLLGLLKAKPDLDPGERLAEMENLVDNYDELIRVLREKIEACRDVFAQIGQGVEEEFVQRLAELEQAERRRQELAARIAGAGHGEAAAGMDESGASIRAMVGDLSRATILIIRKLNHALAALSALASDDEAQRRVYEKLKNDVGLFRDVHEFNRDLSRLAREIAQITNLALSFDAILRDNLGPLAVLIDEIGQVDSRLGESLAEIERLSAELQKGRLSGLGRDLLSDNFVSFLIGARLRGDAVASLVDALADPLKDALDVDFDLALAGSGQNVDFAALAANMKDLVLRGLGPGQTAVPATPEEPPEPPELPEPPRSSPEPGPPAAAPIPEPTPEPWTPPPPRSAADGLWGQVRAPYTAAISRASPTLVLFLLDRSGSMEAPFADGLSRAAYLARVVDKAIQELAVRCNKADGLRDYFHLAALGYGNGTVADAFGPGLGVVGAADWRPISAVARAPLAVDRDGGGLPRPRWIEVQAAGDTPMKAAVEAACNLVAAWCDAHPDSYPPTVINVTDGEPSGESPEAAAAILRRIHTEDGETLFFNLHISGRGAGEVVFPDQDTGLDDYGRLLFRMSSPFPPHLRAGAAAAGFSPGTEARFFVYGAGADLAVRFLNLGTRPAKLA